MKGKQNRFSPQGNMSKYKPFGLVVLPVSGIVSLLCTSLAFMAGNGKEKLQIRYANLRV
ncbi:hypothetical protein [Flavobacterium akiainvivens]|uniref:hypothetical protein n=1 Tax=Flavobacterium akiainvivens TaxID=1202724 RepID=UPI000AE16516|nr:hypothetical protein [Flavobacterium akiainvivens]